jgi:hypothetical protein
MNQFCRIGDRAEAISALIIIIIRERVPKIIQYFFRIIQLITT